MLTVASDSLGQISCPLITWPLGPSSVMESFSEQEFGSGVASITGLVPVDIKFHKIKLIFLLALRFCVVVRYEAAKNTVK